MKTWIRWCGVALVGMSIACGTTETPETDAGVDEEACDEAIAEAVAAYDALDRSCTQDSDCEYRSIGGCNCPIPVAKSASDSAYTSAQSDAQSLCDEYYAGPGAQTCTNNVVCEFDIERRGQVACTDGVCSDSDL